MTAPFQSIVAHLRGDRMIDEAYIGSQVEAHARAGHAEAAQLMAAICAVGYGRARDWREALGWLAEAAERGNDLARGQLRLLANAGEEGSDWRALAASVDVAAWTAPRAGRVVNECPYIAMVEDFLDPPLCAWLIARAAPLQKRSQVYHPVTGKAVEADARTNTTATFQIVDLDLPLVLIRERIANTIGVSAAHFERTSVFRYLPGQEFSSHVDFLSPSPQLDAEIREKGQRPWTFLVYLNDGFEAGETHFLDIDKKFRGRTGEALYFRNVDETGAPDQLTTHAGAPPTSGEKWLLSQFIRDKPQLPG
ncbi:MAG: hypothetical protein A4S17_07175 [Proteobacteria bacterium HN_bin10]|nr:MAG: hypothetical protein A4S17_07175 [Proteobacteria bacterium HN_bin10]